jgi:hypothetical protein
MIKKVFYFFTLIIFIPLFVYPFGNIKRLTDPPPKDFDFSMAPKSPFGPPQTYTITLKANQYKIDTLSDNYHQLTMADFGFLSIPGKPKLPSRNFAIALPPEANIISVEILRKEEITLDGKFNIKPSPIPLPQTKELEEEYERNYQETYFSNNPYPKEVVKYEGCGNMRKWRYALIRFTPFQYQPESKILTFIKNVQIQITYSLPLKSRVKLDDTLFDEKAKRFFINYEDAKKWYQPKSRSEKNPSYYYFILIPSNEYIGPMWNLALWKASLCQPDTVVYATMDWVRGFPGGDLAEKTRNALIYLYNRGIVYALLIGEVWQIPMRECWPDSSNHQRQSWENPVPTDYYYADLTGDWDSDGDGYFGEFGQDAVDFAADIYVGRINLADTSIVRRICTKTVAFEQNTGSWKKKALLLGTFLDSITDCAVMFEQIKDSVLAPERWTYTRLYEKAGLYPSRYPCEDSINRNRTIYWWSSYPFGFVNWNAHGNERSVSRTVYFSPGQRTFLPLFNYDDVYYLNDNYPSIVYSAACLTGIPDTTFYCLGDYLHYRGAVAFIGASRVSYYWPGWARWRQGGNASLNCYFVWWLATSPPWPVGDALYASKLEYDEYNRSDWHDQHNLFVYNLWGDPSLYWPGYTAINEQISSHILPFSPFSISTVNNKIAIYYILSHPSLITITIFDISGKIIKTIYKKKHQKEGNYLIYWNGETDKGTKAKPGIYFCQIEIDKNLYKEKFILLK